MINVLYVDDEPINLQLFQITFKTDFNIVKSTSALEGLEILSKQEVDVIVSDLKMPNMNGVEFIREIKQRYPAKNCILLTGYYEPQLVNDPEVQSIVYKYIHKPFNIDEFRSLIFDAANNR
jgi:response regulator RpfG family c-di-GMP phosphodiesterase